MTPLREDILALGVRLWIAGRKHAHCRFTYPDRPSVKGKNAPLDETVDGLLASEGITLGRWGSPESALYRAYVDEIARRADGILA